MKLVAVLAVLLVVAYAQDAPSSMLCKDDRKLVLVVSNKQTHSLRGGHTPVMRGEVVVTVGDMTPDYLPAPPEQLGMSVLIYSNVEKGTELKLQTFPDPLNPSFEVECTIALGNEFGKQMKCLHDDSTYALYSYYCANTKRYE